MKKVSQLKNSISIKANKSSLRKALRRMFSISATGFIFAGIFYVHLFHNRWTMLLIFICLSIGSCAFYFMLYFLRLNFHKKGLLEFDINGLTDYGSLLRMGHIKLTEIKHIKMTENIFGKWLQVKLKNESPSWRIYLGKHSFFGEFYNIFIGRKLLIPMGIIQFSKFELESQLIHLFNELMNKQSDKADGHEAESSIQGEMGNDQFQTETAIPLFGHMDEYEAESENKAPPAVDENSVLRKIRGIKEKIKNQGFDRLVCDLWTEEICRYPDWLSKNDSRLPQGIHHIHKNPGGENYEEVIFIYEGVSFQFGLRKEIDEKGDSEGLLSVGANGRVVMAIRVRIEIGVLEPLDIEQFLEGLWQGPIESLSHVAAQRRKKESHLRLHMSAEDQGGKSEKSEDLSELKRKFGLDES